MKIKGSNQTWEESNCVGKDKWGASMVVDIVYDRVNGMCWPPLNGSQWKIGRRRGHVFFSFFLFTSLASNLSYRVDFCFPILPEFFPSSRASLDFFLVGRVSLCPLPCHFHSVAHTHTYTHTKITRAIVPRTWRLDRLIINSGQ